MGTVQVQDSRQALSRQICQASSEIPFFQLVQKAVRVSFFALPFLRAMSGYSRSAMHVCYLFISEILIYCHVFLVFVHFYTLSMFLPGDITTAYPDWVSALRGPCLAFNIDLI